MAGLLEIRGVSFSYRDGGRALRDVSASFRAGEVSAVLGPNGSGKTTLLLVAAGLLAPESGEVLLDGRPVRKLGRDFRLRCGLLFQNAEDQLLAPTVWEDVALGPSQMGLTRREIEERVSAALEAVGCSHLARRSTYRLSGGERTRVALAGVLASDPEVVFLDEPTASLDARGRGILADLVGRMGREGRIVVVATQDPELAAAVADRVLVMEGGRAAASGPARAVLSDAARLERGGVRPPPAVRLYEMLFGGGREGGAGPAAATGAGVGGERPVTLEELADLLRGLVRGGRGGVP